ncbi:MAG: HD domain-containing protein [Bacteroidales bacterium]|nr:HD domain-containing protein [Bacteroidales bacterium]
MDKKVDFIVKWEQLLKNEREFLFYFQNRNSVNNHYSVDDITMFALKGIKYYYFGRIEVALKYINLALYAISNIIKEHNTVIIERILQYYKTSIFCDENSINLKNSILIYKHSFNENKLGFGILDPSINSLLKILFHQDFPEGVNNIQEYFDKTKTILNNLENSISKEYTTLYEFVIQRLLDVIATYNETKIEFWNDYVKYITDKTKFIVDLPRATLKYFQLLKKDDKFTRELSNKNNELKEIIEQTKNAQVELVRVDIERNTFKKEQLDNIILLENVLNYKSITYKFFDYCLDLLWGIDNKSVELSKNFLEFIIRIEKEFLYLFNGNLIPEYVDHGIGHVYSILQNLLKIQTSLSQAGISFLDYFYLTKKDYRNLIIAILFHDIGMNGYYDNKKIKYTLGGKRIRDNHAVLSWYLIKKNLGNYGIKADVIDEIALIASMHTAKYSKIDRRFKYTKKILNKFNEYQNAYNKYLQCADVKGINNSIALLQLLDGIDLNKDRIGIQGKYFITPAKKKKYEYLLKKSGNKQVQKYFNMQIDCIGEWNKHYTLHSYTKNISILFSNNRLVISIKLDKSYTDKDFVQNVFRKFPNVLLAFRESSIKIMTKIYDDEKIYKTIES